MNESQVESKSRQNAGPILMHNSLRNPMHLFIINKLLGKLGELSEAGLDEFQIISYNRWDMIVLELSICLSFFHWAGLTMLRAYLLQRRMIS